MSIHLIIGPMFAGKTTQLLKMAMQKELAGLSVVYVKHRLDKKRHETKIRAHTGELSANNALLANELMDVYDQLTKSGVQVICVDEGQFFRDLAPVAQLLASKHRKTIIVAALNATFKRHMFSTVSELLPYVEKMDLLTAQCFKCQNNNAQFTHRLMADQREDGEVKMPLDSKIRLMLQSTLIGGQESYESLCRQCLYSKLKEEDPINTCL